MAVDWGFAAQVGGLGFGLVFTVLVMLALVIRLVSLVIGKFTTGQVDTGARKN